MAIDGKALLFEGLAPPLPATASGRSSDAAALTDQRTYWLGLLDAITVTGMSR
jgi:hypothetical protein